MAQLRSIFEEAGCSDVTTYVQSGNVVFTHTAPDAGEDEGLFDRLKADLEQAIEAATGFGVPVVLRTAAQWAVVVDGNPYEGVEPDPTKVHVAFLDGEPSADAADLLSSAAKGREEFTLVGRHVYLHLPDGLGRADLPKGLDKLGAPATVRNWRTVTKLHDLLAA